MAEWDDELARRLAVADELSDYAVEVRYPPPAPDVDAEATAEEARTALKSAREVKRVLRAELEPILP